MFLSGAAYIKVIWCTPLFLFVMALVVEDGTGLSTAESFGSVAECDTYNSLYVQNAIWTASVIAADKEHALRIATQYMQAVFALRWRGTRLLGTQALAWPRYNVLMPDTFCYYLPSNTVPQLVKNACFELAIKVLAGTALMVDVAGADRSVISELDKVGPLETETKWSGGRPNQQVFSLVEQILSTLLTFANRLDRA